MQLPPVRSNYSTALTEIYIKNYYGLKCQNGELSKVIRQESNSGILENAEMIKRSISNSNYNSFKIFESADVQKIDSNFIPAWKSAPDDKIVITFSNKGAFEANKLIRTNLYENSNQLNDNETLIVSSNNYKNQLLNGDLVTLLSCEPLSENFIVPLKGRPPVKLSFRRVSIMKKSANGEYKNIDTLIIENLLWNDSPRLKKDEIFALRILAAQKMGVKLPSRKLKKDNPLLYMRSMEEYNLKLRDSEFLNALHVKFGHAITCHKAQGGEWSTVFVDFKRQGYSSENFFRWAYTAITRAKSKLYTINSPEFKCFMIFPKFEKMNANENQKPHLITSYSNIL
jgi:hypothetical protein